MANCFSDFFGVEGYCNNNTTGYTGRVWIFSTDCRASFKQNSREVVEKIMRLNSEVSAPYVSCYDAQLVQPLVGTAVAGNTDRGVRLFEKSVVLRISARHAGKIESVVMPLVLERKGYIIIAERLENGNNKYVVFGAYDPCVCDIASVTQSEFENNGDWVMTFKSIEPVPIVRFVRENSDATQNSTTWLEDKCK